ncbi:MAG: universal stress protein [Candidatus Binataceae bacterium]
MSDEFRLHVPGSSKCPAILLRAGIPLYLFHGSAGGAGNWESSLGAVCSDRTGDRNGTQADATARCGGAGAFRDTGTVRAMWAKETLRAVQELGVDSVEIPTRGRKGVRRFFLGSVAEKVVRESPCPDLTVR